jgi:hypothetical protein
LNFKRDPGAGKNIIPDPDPWGNKAPDPRPATLVSRPTLELLIIQILIPQSVRTLGNPRSAYGIRPGTINSPYVAFDLTTCSIEWSRQLR